MNISETLPSPLADRKTAFHIHRDNLPPPRLYKSSYNMDKCICLSSLSPWSFVFQCKRAYPMPRIEMEGKERAAISYQSSVGDFSNLEILKFDIFVGVHSCSVSSTRFHFLNLRQSQLRADCISAVISDERKAISSHLIVARNQMKSQTGLEKDGVRGREEPFLKRFSFSRVQRQ